MTPRLTPTVDLFAEMLMAEKGSSPNTVSAYLSDLHDLATFIVPTSLEQAQDSHLRSYLKSLSEKGFEGSSIARKLSVIRHYYLFLVREGHRHDNPSHTLESPKKHLTLPKLLSSEEITRLITCAQQDTTPEGIRLNLFLELLYCTGMRVT